MKRLFIALTMVLALGMSATAQKTLHRHNPQVVNGANGAPDEEIVAYSDTTNAVSAGADNATDSIDESYTATSGRGLDDSKSFDDVSDPFELIAYLLERSGMRGVFIAALVVLLCILTVLSPFIMVALIIYFVMGNRNRKYKIIEKAVESGQPIPHEILRDNNGSNDRLWGKGIRNAAVGIGIVAFGLVISADFFTGVGWIVFFYGVGQAVVARTSSSGKKRGEERPFMDDITDSDREKPKE